MAVGPPRRRGRDQLAVYDGGQFRPVARTSRPIRWVPTVTAPPSGDVLVVGGYDDQIRLYDDALLVTASQIGTDAGVR